MIAHVTGLSAGEFVHTLGDAHVYNNHFDALKEQVINEYQVQLILLIKCISSSILLQLSREPLPFPKLRMKRKVENIEDFSIDDLEVEGYKSHGKVDMKMAV